ATKRTPCGEHARPCGFESSPCPLLNMPVLLPNSRSSCPCLSILTTRSPLASLTNKLPDDGAVVMPDGYFICRVVFRSIWDVVLEVSWWVTSSARDIESVCSVPSGFQARRSTSRSSPGSRLTWRRATGTGARGDAAVWRDRDRRVTRLALASAI